MKMKKLLSFLLCFAIIFAGLPAVVAQADTAPTAQWLDVYTHTITTSNRTKSVSRNITVPARGVIKFESYRLFDVSGTEQYLRFDIYKSSDLSNPVWYSYSNKYETSTETYVSLIGLDAGSYVVKVTPSMYSSSFPSNNTYQLTFGVAFVNINGYEIEPNNSVAQANTMAFNTPVCAYADNTSEDYYAITVSKDTIARIKFKNYTALSENATIRFLPGDGSSAQYLSSSKAGVGSDHHYFDVLLKAGTNYINITQSYEKVQTYYEFAVTQDVKLSAPVFYKFNKTGTKVEYYWNVMPDVDGYEVYRKINNGSWKKLLTSSGPSYNGFYQINTDYKQTYQFRVRAFKTVGGTKIYSGWSVIKSLNPTPTNIKLSASDYTYNGKTKTPKVTVKNKLGVKLKEGTDYTVKYASGRKKIGKYKVTVTFKGNYSGKKYVYFNINPKGTSVSSVSAAYKSLKVKFKKQTSNTSGYQVQYSTSKKFKSYKTATVKSNKTTSVTLKGLKAKKTYYVRVRTFKTVSGKKYYSSWSSYKTKKTK